MPGVAGNVRGLCGGTAVSRRRAMMIVGVRRKQISGMNYGGASHLESKSVTL
jgi:hypothetical protein